MRAYLLLLIDPSEFVHKPALKTQPSTGDLFDLPSSLKELFLQWQVDRLGWPPDDRLDRLSTQREDLPLLADSSSHRTVKNMEQSRYRDTLGAYHRSSSAADPQVSYEFARGYDPKSSSQVVGRKSGQSNAELALADINRDSGRLPHTEQGAILDMRTSPRGLKGKGRVGLVTPSYASVVAASTSDTIAGFEGATPSGTGPEQISSASTAAKDSPAAKEAQRWAALNKKDEREADESIRPLDGQPKAMIREGKEALGAPEQPSSSARVALQRFPTEAVRHSSPPNTRIPPYPTSPILGPSLVRGDFQARRRYSEGNSSIELEPILYSYFSGSPLLSNEAGSYTSQPVSRDSSVESARSNRSVHSTGHLERSRRRQSLTETEAMLPATPRIPPTSFQFSERTRDWESSDRKQTKRNTLFSSNKRNSNSKSKDSGFTDSFDYGSNLDMSKRRRNSNSASKNSRFIESSDDWIANPKTEK
jgi:hypothetical protein